MVLERPPRYSRQSIFSNFEIQIGPLSPSWHAFSSTFREIEILEESRYASWVTIHICLYFRTQVNLVLVHLILQEL